MKEILLGAFPGDLFVGEERGAAGSDAGAPAWIADPLDGTANFVRGFPHWAVSIGRTAGGWDGELVLGVIWDPAKKDLFVAEEGAGAFRNGTRVRGTCRTGLAGAALATGFPFLIQARIDTYLRVFKAVFLEVQSPPSSSRSLRETIVCPGGRARNISLIHPAVRRTIKKDRLQRSLLAVASRN